MRKISLITLAYRKAGIVLGVMVLSLAVNLWVIHRHIHQLNFTQGQRTLNQYSQNIGEQLLFYRNIIRQLAHQDEARDILIMNDAVAAHFWAQRQQHYLPHSIGLALVNLDGQVLGTPVELRLGPSCIADLSKRHSRQPLSEPLVHRDNPRHAHFDMTETVVDSFGQAVGTLFVSFSLESLQAALAHSVLPQETLILRDQNRSIIAQAGTTSDEGEILRHEIHLAESAWRLELIHPETNTLPIYLALGGANLATSAFIITVFVTVIVTMVRLFLVEFDRIKTMLHEINTDNSITMSESRLKETGQILPVIQAIAQNIQNKQAELVTLSLTDELTQLPNRRRFNLELERACNLPEHGMTIGLLLIDVDFFKQVNDSIGHAMGDRVLQVLATCLRHNTRKSDFPARLGGDEFAVVMTNMQKEHLSAWAQRIRADFRTALENDPLTAANPLCTVSMGAAFAECSTTRNPTELFRRADQALYLAKKHGRNRLEISQMEF